MASRFVTLHAPSAGAEIALTAFVLLVLFASATLLVCWVGLAAP